VEGSVRMRSRSRLKLQEMQPKQLSWQLKKSKSNLLKTTWTSARADHLQP